MERENSARTRHRTGVQRVKLVVAALFRRPAVKAWGGLNTLKVVPRFLQIFARFSGDFHRRSGDFARLLHRFLCMESWKACQSNGVDMSLIGGLVAEPRASARVRTLLGISLVIGAAAM